jgi:hypothetical protein
MIAVTNPPKRIGSKNKNIISLSDFIFILSIVNTKRPKTEIMLNPDKIISKQI